MVNALSESMALGKVSSLFIGLVIAYMVLYFISRASGFLWVFGYNYFRCDVDEFFHKIFMIKTDEIPQEKFFDTAFMEKYTFVRKNTDKISSYLGSLLNLIFSNIGTIIGSISIFAAYEPWLILNAAVVAAFSVVVNGYVTKKNMNLIKLK